jgi:hypothetical protein
LLCVLEIFWLPCSWPHIHHTPAAYGHHCWGMWHQEPNHVPVTSRNWKEQWRYALARQPVIHRKGCTFLVLMLRLLKDERSFIADCSTWLWTFWDLKLLHHTCTMHDTTTENCAAQLFNWVLDLLYTCFLFR